MAQNVRIAQIGQVAVNRPFYEVRMNGRKYAAFVNRANRVEFVRPKTLCEVGITSEYADTFEETLNAEIVQALNITGSTTDFNRRFPRVTLGTGLAFVDDFLPYKGWAALVPDAFLNLSVQ